MEYQLNCQKKMGLLLYQQSKEENKINIRKIEEKDLIEVAKIKVKTWRDTYKGIVDENYLKNMDYIQTANKWKKNFENENFIVAEKDKRIVGFCRYGNRIDELERFREFDTEIYALYIDKEYQKMGIGKKIVDYVKKEMSCKNRNKFLIWCLEKNENSLEFYKKIGGKFLGKKQAKIGEKIYSEIAYGYEIKKY